MSEYFMDCEFLEGAQTKRFLGIPIGKTKPTIDLISIGIVSGEKCSFDTDDDGNCGSHPKGCPTREYYAISKDFNLREAWNRYDMKPVFEDGNEVGEYKEYWIRDNVLMPIYKGFIRGDARNYFDFSYSTMKYILKKYGKTNKEIAEDIIHFINGEIQNPNGIHSYPVFYAYYADYDWVVFCWLFGNMIALPSGFPMYCRDLKQMLDERLMIQHPVNGTTTTLLKTSLDARNAVEIRALETLGEKLEWIEKYCNEYPKETNTHNALSDAKWNKQLYEFIQKL